MTVNSATFSRRRWRSVYRLVGFSSREVRKSRPSAATENSSFYFTSRHPRLGNCEKVLRQEARAYTGQPIWPVGRGKKGYKLEKNSKVKSYDPHRTISPFLASSFVRKSVTSRRVLEHESSDLHVFRLFSINAVY